MKTQTLVNIVDMCTFAASSVDFSQVYEFENGTKMSVSRNAMLGGHRAGYMGVLPYDKAGNQIDARAENWLTALEVAQKMEILASE
jgi:hypothetical protein